LPVVHVDDLLNLNQAWR